MPFLELHNKCREEKTAKTNKQTEILADISVGRQLWGKISCTEITEQLGQSGTGFLALTLILFSSRRYIAIDFPRASKKNHEYWNEQVGIELCAPAKENLYWFHFTDRELEPGRLIKARWPVLRWTINSGISQPSQTSLTKLALHMTWRKKAKLKGHIIGSHNSPLPSNANTKIYRISLYLCFPFPPPSPLHWAASTKILVCGYLVLFQQHINNERQCHSWASESTMKTSFNRNDCSIPHLPMAKEDEDGLPQSAQEHFQHVFWLW